MDKNSLRKKMRLKRDLLNPAAIRKNSSIIFSHFKNTIYPLLAPGGPVISYISTRSEVRTGRLVRFLLGEKRRVYAPCVVNRRICPGLITRSCKMVKRAFDIYEPASIKKIKSYRNTAAVIIPGIAFDLKGNRLGFGGGFFDRFLGQLPEKTVKIALAFSGQLVKNVPHNRHDVKMDYIITEKGVFQV